MSARKMEGRVRVLCFPSLLAAGLAAAASAASGPADPAAAVAGALVAGEAALARHDARALMAAAAALARFRARDLEGDDLTTRWAQQAVAWGARPVALPVWRGRMGGPGYRRFELAPGARFQTRQVFSAGQVARVSLAALGQGPFRLAVAGGDAARLCERSGSAGQVACTWTPAFSEPHEIVVENPQGRPARFYLVTD